MDPRCSGENANKLLLPLSGADRLPCSLRGKPAAAGRRSSRGVTAYSLAACVKADGRNRLDKFPLEKPAAAGRPSRGMTAQSRAGGTRKQTVLRILGQNVGAGYRRPSSASVGYRRKRAAAQLRPAKFFGRGRAAPPLASRGGPPFLLPLLA